MERWSRIFRSEETETEFSFWIPTEISGIFGIMGSTLGLGSLQSQGLPANRSQYGYGDESS